MVIYNLLEALIVLVPILMTVAFVTIAERKIMGAMQRRCGPNAVGIWGILQPFADALKLLVKEIIIPRQSNSLLFIIGPCITLIFALLGWAIIPFGEGLAIFDYEFGVFFGLAVSSLGSYGILISGWAANSKYAFMGAIRSTAQLLSYELVFSSIILILILFSGSLSLTYIVESQQAVWNFFPLLPIGLMFFIAILAETNRAPFDLPEAESELVAGFMTEHGASIFVFFFLGEYSSLILMSAFMSVFFLGGHHCPDLHKLFINPLINLYYFLETELSFFIEKFSILYSSLVNFLNIFQSEKLSFNPVFNYDLKENIVDWNIVINDFYFYFKSIKDYTDQFQFEILKEGNSQISVFLKEGDYINFLDKFWNNLQLFISSFTLNIKGEYFISFNSKDIILETLILFIDKLQGSYIFSFKIIFVVFFFIWVRASFPRLRYDQLMSLCWKELLPLVFAYIIFAICFFYTFDMMPFGTNF